MSVATQRAALAALIGGISGIGNVHAYERYVREESAFRSLYLYTPPGGEAMVLGWFIRCTAIKERTLGVGRIWNQMTWQVRGYRALADAEQSEIAFANQVEQIRAAYRADPTLGGVCAAEMLGEDDGVQLLDAGPVLFCGVLCHSALMEVNLWSYL